MKRLIALALAVAFMAAACGSSSKSTSSATTASAGTSATAGASSAATPSTGNPPSPVTLTEDGSSLLFPFLQELIAPLKQKFPNITLQPAAGGSGKGITDVSNGVVDMGGSDAYLTPGQMQQHPTLSNIPIAVSAQSVDYNVPGVSSMKLSGDVLAQIYQGKISKWNDPQIASLNPGANLPATSIVPVRRVDSSGDTFLFTSFLSATNTTWNNGPNYGTTVTWPSVGGELTASGNPGMVQTCKATPGCVAYVGISAQASATAAGLGQAMLKNQAGNFLLPSQATITSAVDALTGKIPDSLAVSLIYASGAQSYPIVNFEYLVVNQKQSDTNKALASRTFLSFAIDTSGGSQPQYLQKVNFVPLPTSVVPKVNTAIAKIGS